MIDFRIDQDLLFYQGDLYLAEASQQNIEHLLLAQKGSYKEYPLLGVGIENYLRGNSAINKLRLEAEIEKQLEFDNFKVRLIDVTNLNAIQIDGNY
ncbi:conserved hypothetical protein [Tenacibaculum litopenaei]|jgi:hypothetical protein|uniref:hypothetical protein n=1 Tax=Tenacibaculum litopenaei TaxID=396016 RepID=UPI003894579C